MGKATPTLRQAIELSMDQQLLVQHLSNTYLMLCHDHQAIEQYSIRSTSVERFEEQLYQLSLLVPTTRIREHIKEVREAWQAYKKIVDWSIHKQHIKSVIEQAEHLQQACKLLFAAYREYEYGWKSSNDLVTVNQYSTQTYQLKLLLAKITTYYLAHQLMPEEASFKHQLVEFRHTFMRSLVVLQRAETGADLVGNRLRTIEQEWKAMERITTDADRGLASREEWLVYTGSILEQLDQVIHNYERLSEQLSSSHAIAASIQQTITVQRIVSAYLTHMKDPTKADYYQDILDQVAAFERGLEALEVTAEMDEAVALKVRSVRALWKNYRLLAIQSDTRDELRAIKLLEQCHVLTAACDGVEQAIKKHLWEDTAAYDPRLEQIQRLQRLQVSLERLQVYRQMTSMHLDPTLSSRRFQACSQEFEQGLAELQLHQAEHPTPQEQGEALIAVWEQYRSMTLPTDEWGALYLQKEQLAKTLRQLLHWYQQQLHVSYAQQPR